MAGHKSDATIRQFALAATRAAPVIPWASSAMARAINLAVSGLIGSAVSGRSAAAPAASPVSSDRAGCQPGAQSLNVLQSCVAISGKRGRPPALLLYLRRRGVRRCFLGGLARLRSLCLEAAASRGEFAGQCGDTLAFLQRRLPQILGAERHDRGGAGRGSRPRLCGGGFRGEARLLNLESFSNPRGANKAPAAP